MTNEELIKEAQQRNDKDVLEQGLKTMQKLLRDRDMLTDKLVEINKLIDGFDYKKNFYNNHLPY